MSTSTSLGATTVTTYIYYEMNIVNISFKHGCIYIRSSKVITHDTHDTLSQGKGTRSTDYCYN